MGREGVGAAEGLEAEPENAKNGRAIALPNGKAWPEYDQTSDATLPRYDKAEREQQAWRPSTAGEEKASATQEAAGSTRRRTSRTGLAAARGKLFNII